jgi:hypothetical protein
MAGTLTPEQQWALIKAHGSLDNARDEAIWRSPELQDLWNDWWPRTPDFWKAFWKIALPVLGMVPEAATSSRAAEAVEDVDRGRSWPVPFETFWPIFRLAVEEDASARRLAKETDENDKLQFVNRIKAGALVNWVKKNPEEARRRLREAELPPGFSATRDGVVFPSA